MKNWPNVEDVEIIVRPHHAWMSNVLPRASVDEESQLALTSVDATYAMNPLHFLKTTQSCWVENALEELDVVGAVDLEHPDRHHRTAQRPRRRVVAGVDGEVAEDDVVARRQARSSQVRPA